MAGNDCFKIVFSKLLTEGLLLGSLCSFAVVAFYAVCAIRNGVGGLDHILIRMLLYVVIFVHIAFGSVLIALCTRNPGSGAVCCYLRFLLFDMAGIPFLSWIAGTVLGLDKAAFQIAHVSAALAIKLVQQKRQLRLFIQQLKEIREERQERLIRVEGFDRESLDLAKELQQYVEEEKKLILEAEADRQAVKTMVAGISHDFRTPLTAAMGYLQMIGRDDALSENSGLYLDKAQAKMSYLRELSDEFFALSMIESSNDEERVKLSMKRLLEEVALSQHEWIEKAGLTFTADVTEEGCDIYASEVDMRRLLENLYSNARKYALSRMYLSLKPVEDKAFELSFSNDCSLGQETDISDVFVPFYRGSSGNVPGSGLGLYVVKRIVEKYNGEISAQINDAGDFEIKIII